MIYIFYGPEGSGKSTQAKILSKKLRLPYISTGDMVRFYSKNNRGKLGQACKNILDNGIYLEDKYAYLMLEKRLNEDNVKSGFILDGFPRNLRQAKFLDKLLGENGKKISAAFYLYIDIDTAIKRVMFRKRDNNDTLKKLKNRLGSYYGSEEGTLSYYREQKLLKRINGCPAQEVVTEQILKKVNNF